MNGGLRLTCSTDALPEFEYRLVELHGRFDPSRTLFVGPRTKDGQGGFTVVMPFKRTSGGPDVLVNRGFVLKSQTIGDGIHRRLKATGDGVSSDVSLVALLPRVFAPKHGFANEPHNNFWLSVDPAAMAAFCNEHAGGVVPAPSAGQSGASSSSWRDALGLQASSGSATNGAKERVIPVYLEEVFDGPLSQANAMVASGVPLGREPQIELRNQHAEYAFTWCAILRARR